MIIMEHNIKELLLKDICSRLPYGLLCKVDGIEDPQKLIRIEVDEVGGVLLDFGDTLDGYPIQGYLSEVKPYLRHLSSITEKEKTELQLMLISLQVSAYDYSKEIMAITIDFYDSHHFDYRNLISKGVALEALEGMYI